MPLTSPQAQLIGQGLDFVNSLANRRAQRKQNEADRQFSKDQTAQQRQWDIEDWDKTNAYNHPAEQMNRLRQAGLNPNLVYGKGADNTAVMIKGGAVQPLQKQEAPQLNYSAANAIMQYQQVKTMQQQTDNLAQQNALMQADKNLRDAQAESERAKKAGYDLQNIQYGKQNNLLEFDYGQKLRLADLEVSGKMLDNSLKDQSLKLNKDRYELERMSTAADVQQKYIQGLQMKAQTLQTEMETSMYDDKKQYLKKQIEYVEAQIENLEKTGKLLDGQTAKQAVDKQLAEFELGLQKRYATKERWLELIEKGNKAVQGSKEVMNPFNIGQNPLY
jgi:ribosomal protein L25 (general stress protein Ctc)